MDINEEIQNASLAQLISWWVLRAGLKSANEIKRGYACTQAGFRNIKALKDEVRELRKDADRFVANSARIGCEMFDLVWSAA
jgi:hypothetical protein